MTDMEIMLNYHLPNSAPIHVVCTKHIQKTMRRNYLLLSPVALMFIATMHSNAQEAATDGKTVGIHRVYDYCPAPGQFLNTMPEYEEGDTRETMRHKAEQLLLEGGTISLGAFGGYVVFGFDHMVENRPGLYDLQILGNSYLAEADQTRDGGSCEPAVVYVSHDDNGNGLPDDTWYELAGSEYGKVGTWRNYTVTYHRTPQDHKPTPRPNSPITDSTYIHWTDSEGGEGYLEMNAYHRQNYWPMWLADEPTITLSGVRLAPNSVDTKGDGSYFLQNTYPWGYADNQPNDSAACKLDLQWAVDANGNPANLPGIHFVKVQTAVMQSNGWIGESSTEVAGALDLHLAGGSAPSMDENLALLSFENDDYKGVNGSLSYWSDLVDNPQYGGVLLYGESGTGAYAEEDAYSWYDQSNTFLSSTVNNSWGAWAYWNGGIAVSDYVDSNISNVTYSDQLTIFRNNAEAGRGGGGRNGSDHFAVINGCDNSASGGSDSRAILTFGDGVARVIDHVYVAPTTYFLSNMVHGSSFCTAATDSTFVDLVAEGYDANGQHTSTLKLRLVEGLRHVQGWTWFDLSSLGKVSTVKFNFSVSNDQIGPYGINTPAYVAIDDVAVRIDGTDTGIHSAPSVSAPESTRMYDLMGRELRSVRKGQIVIQGGKKVVY